MKFLLLLLIFLFISSKVALADSPTMQIYVKDIKDIHGPGMAGIVITTLGNSGISAPTGNTGKGKVLLPAGKHIGDQVNLIFKSEPHGRDMTIVSPWGGTATIPASADGIVIVLADRQDYTTLVDGKQIVILAEAFAKAASSSRTESNVSPNDLVNQYAKKLGFSPKVVREAIAAWVRRAGTPESKKLADQYVNQFQPDPSRDCQTVATERCRELLNELLELHRQLKDFQHGNLGTLSPWGDNHLENWASKLTYTFWKDIFRLGLGTYPFHDTFWIGVPGHRVAIAPALTVTDPTPDYGVVGPYTTYGIPSLYNIYIRSSHVMDQSTKLNALLKPYTNPQGFPFNDFLNRCNPSDDFTGGYSYGKNIQTDQFRLDLSSLDEWFNQLEATLRVVPTYFGNPPLKSQL